eukprot:snap_masked-scaffold_24-processed-gene-2.51-mRNA-1 protein AED:1.00 eAED:1.00 QI:0/0/0/0/1/1/2/0/74
MKDMQNKSLSKSNSTVVLAFIVQQVDRLEERYKVFRMDLYPSVLLFIASEINILALTIRRIMPPSRTFWNKKLS